MRRHLCILLSVLMLSCFAACEKQEHVHKFGKWEIVQEADCAETGVKERECSCGEKETKTIPASGEHEFTSEVTKEASVLEEGLRTYTCSVCGYSYTELIEKLPPNWVIDYYVDEFGDKTNDAYVRGKFHGTFSNSVTSGSSLKVCVYLDKDKPNKVSFRLFEYDSFIATAISSDTITLKIKTESGATKSYSLSDDGDDFYCVDSFLSSAVFSNTQLSCVITISGDYTSVADTYQFKIDNIGLQELWNET